MGRHPSRVNSLIALLIISIRVEKLNINVAGKKYYSHHKEKLEENIYNIRVTYNFLKGSFRRPSPLDGGAALRNF